jgi:hypothetical protein
MRRYLGVLALLVLLGGCAAYKELQPEPPVSPAERGYIELKDDKNDFELEQGKKYFIKFPSPARDHYRLVLVAGVKPALHSFLTSSFDGGDGPFTPIPDETASNDSLSVYAIGTRIPAYFWVIDDVRHDLILNMHYRYVPEWRYTFENRYAEYKEILSSNTVDRSTYNSINRDFNFEGFNFSQELSNLDSRHSKVQAMNEELRQLAKVFPPDIATSRDTAYQQYQDLVGRVTNELRFQESYGTALTLFKKERDSRGDMGKFLEAVPYFSSVMSQSNRFTDGVIEKARDVLSSRLGGIKPYYETKLRSKEDLEPITPQPSPDAIQALYKACDQQIPRDTDDILHFVQRFNVESKGLSGVMGKFKDLETDSRNYANAKTPGTTAAAFYQSQLAKVGQIRQQIPEALAGRSEKYGNVPAAVMMTEEISKTTRLANDLESLYSTASHAAQMIQSQSWMEAEAGLRQLADDRTYSDSKRIDAQRDVVVKGVEKAIFTGVKQATQQRVDAFTKAHESTYLDVPKLYQDSVFFPVYQLTFSSLGQTDLMQKRKEIEDYLEHAKYYEFPENSIKTIYRDFIRNINDHGVERARAIADHGKNYRGKDKQVLAMVDECNVGSAKWIVKPREYRKLYALPVTTNKQGSNDYMFRIRLNIPSDAQFPVFDINIKLPPEVAQKAAASRWYEEITINKKPIKNEGRFRITAPMAANDYESLITPVQMDKDGNNILEVKFKYPGFKVFEVSAMAQVPIIRKN